MSDAYEMPSRTQMLTQAVKQTISETTAAGLQLCPWCRGKPRTLPLGMCRGHAALPDCLAALERCLVVLESIGKPECAAAQHARSAIAKAGMTR